MQLSGYIVKLYPPLWLPLAGMVFQEDDFYTVRDYVCVQ